MSIKKTYIPAKPRSSKLVGTFMSGGVAGSGSGMTSDQVATLSNLASWWKLDDDGNLFSELNVYSTKELSAYGYGGLGGDGGDGSHVEWGATTNNYSPLTVEGVTKTVALSGHAHNWADITNTPTTLSGYGITNAYTKTQVDDLISGTGTGSVTSVGMTVPTGLTVSGSPITTSGTLAIGLQSGYSIPTITKQGQWDAAYGWGNHASAGYALNSSLSNYVPTSRIITAGTGLTGGGSLSVNRALALDTAYTDGRYYGYTDSAIDNLEIGGRNLLLNSENRIRFGSNDDRTYPIEDRAVSGENYRRFRRTYPEGITSTRISIYTPEFFTPEKSGYYTYSTYFRPNEFDIELRLYFVTFGNYVLCKANEWTQVSVTDYIEAGVRTRLYGVHGVMPPELVQWIDYNRVSVTSGNKATDWTPAPEDVQAEIDSKLSLTGGTLTGSLTAPTFIGNLTGTATNVSRNIIAGNGLTGGGMLTANRTLSLDTTYTDDRYLRRNITRLVGSIDDVRTPGLQAAGSETTDTPTGRYTFSPVLTLQSDTDRFVQLYYNAYSGENQRAWMRGGTSSAWNSWREFAFTDSNITGNASTATTLANSRSIAMTGDVNWSVNFNGGANVTATGTIQSNAVTTAKILDNNVTFAKVQNIATSSILGRSTAGTGNVEALTTIPSTVLGNSSLYIGTTQVALNRPSGLLNLNLGGGDISGVREISADYVEAENLYIDGDGEIFGDLELYGNLNAYGSVNTPKVIFNAAGWSMEQVGTELQMKHNGNIRMRFLSDGSIVATAGITALSTE